MKNTLLLLLAVILFSFSANAQICITPINISASNQTANSVDISWNDVNSTTPDFWEIEIGVSGFIPTGVANITGITSIPYALTGLPSGTEFCLYLRSACTATSISPWTTTPFCFSTTGTPTSVSQNPSDIRPILIFPNPSKGVINIQTKLFKQQGASIEIFDLQGKLIQQIKYNEQTSNALSINLKHAGIYLSKTTLDNGQILREKVMIQ